MAEERAAPRTSVGGIQGCSMGSLQPSGFSQGINQLVSSLDCDMAVQAAICKQYDKMHDTAKAFLGEVEKINQEKQELEKTQEELSLKNKELGLEMERLLRENEEFSLKNKELSLELQNFKKKLVERESVRGESNSGHSQVVQTRSVCNEQVHEGGTIDKVPQEGSFDPVQSNRVIFENHERQIELTEIRRKLKDVFTNIDHQDGLLIGIKALGLINEKPFLDASCGNNDIAKVEAAKKCSEWQQKIEGHIWRPYKRIAEDGHSEEVLDEEDETLKELKACGQGIYDAVGEALKEMEKYSSSGRTVVHELWNYKEGRKATAVECIDFLEKEVMEHEQYCKKRKRISPRFR